jgi:hypothetical protein
MMPHWQADNGKKGGVFAVLYKNIANKFVSPRFHP